MKYKAGKGKLQDAMEEFYFLQALALGQPQLENSSQQTEGLDIVLKTWKLKSII